MATLTFAVPTDADEMTPFVATAPAGDKFLISATGKDHLFVFQNGHTSPITITVAGVAKTVNAGTGFGSGSWTAPSRVIVVTNALTGSMILTASEIKAYMDVDNYVNFAYTGGNAAMKVLAFSI